jgi:hypothetical protein
LGKHGGSYGITKNGEENLSENSLMPTKLTGLANTPVVKIVILKKG